MVQVARRWVAALKRSRRNRLAGNALAIGDDCGRCDLMVTRRCGFVVNWRALAVVLIERAEVVQLAIADVILSPSFLRVNSAKNLWLRIALLDSSRRSE